MRRILAVALMVVFSINFGALNVCAKEKLTLNAPYDEMPSEVQSSETFVEQLYVQEKRSFDQKISQAKKPNPKVPLYQYRKYAPSADKQKSGIEVVE